MTDIPAIHENPELQEQQPQSVLMVRNHVSIADLAETQARSLQEVWRAMSQNGNEPTGAPYVRYHTFGEVETDVEVGIPVRRKASSEPPVTAADLPGGPAVTLWHLGAHDGLAAAYDRLNSWLSDNQRTPSGPAWEVYWWVDPTVEPDPAAWPQPSEWKTQLIQPVE